VKLPGQDWIWAKALIKGSQQGKASNWHMWDSGERKTCSANLGEEAVPAPFRRSMKQGRPMGRRVCVYCDRNWEAYLDSRDE